MVEFMFDEESEKTKQNLKSPKCTNESFSFWVLVLDVLICLLHKNDLFTSTAILLYDRRIVFAPWLTATQVGVITVRSTNNYMQKNTQVFLLAREQKMVWFLSLGSWPCLIHFVICWLTSLFLCPNLLCNKRFIFCLVVSRSVMQNPHMYLINLVARGSHCRLDERPWERGWYIMIIYKH